MPSKVKVTLFLSISGIKTNPLSYLTITQSAVGSQSMIAPTRALDKTEQTENHDKNRKEILFDYFELSINDVEIWSVLKDDLCQIAIKDYHKGSSIYKMINRILVVFQLPTKLTIYEKVHKEFVFKYTTATDPVYREDFQNYLKVLQHDELNEYLIQFYNTSYYLLPTRLLCNPPESKKPFSFDHYPEGKAALKIIKAVFSNHIALQNPLFNELCLADYWQKKLDDAFENYSIEIEDSYPKTVPTRTWKESELSHISNLAVEESYAKYFDSPLLAGMAKDSSPNICYFTRCFDSSYPNNGSGKARFGYYNYQVKMVIPPTQRKHFKNTFSKIRHDFLNSIGFTNACWSFGEREFEYFNQNSRSEYDKLFFDILTENDGVERIIEILQSPYGDNTRCFVDPVLRSGFMDVRRDPFRNHDGLDWIDAPTEENTFQKDKIRMIALYYLFNAMLPNRAEKRGGRISCLIKPLRGDFGSWLAFVHVSEFSNSEDEQLINLQRYRQFYHGIAVMQGRRIRDEMFNLYVNEISTAVQKGLVDLFKNVNSNQEKQSIYKFIDDTNEQFMSLCGIYPYHQVEIIFLNEVVSNKKNQVSFFGLPNKNIQVNLKDNPCFPPVIGFSPPDRSSVIAKAIEHGLYQIAVNYNFSLENWG